MEFPMSNSKLQNIADDLEKEQLEKGIDNVVQIIEEKIIAAAYSQCGLECHVLNGVGRKRTNVGFQRGDPKSILGHSDKVMPNKLSVQINSLSQSRLLHANSQDRIHILYQVYDFTNYIPEIISKIQQIFPEMKILVDPMNTYILFDWS